jgi:N-methylhydantoinase A
LEHDASQGFFRSLADLPEARLRDAIAALTARCAAAMAADGAEADETEISAAASFMGQGHTLDVVIPTGTATPGEAIRQGFIEAHRLAYGHTRNAPVRLVELRVVQRKRSTTGAMRWPADATTPDGSRPATIFGQALEVPILHRARLAIGQRRQGPAIIEQADSTTVVPPGWSFTAHPTHLLLEAAP